MSLRYQKETQWSGDNRAYLLSQENDQMTLLPPRCLDKEKRTSLEIHIDPLDQAQSLPTLFIETSVAWLHQRFDSRVGYLSDQRIRFWKDLVLSECFESFLATKFPGAKRFGLEGLDSFTVGIRHLCRQGGVDHIFLGMAHRGRLCTLHNLAGKPFSEICNDFQGHEPKFLYGSGDVKYHRGYDGVFRTEELHLSVTVLPNPSHLEFIYPVLLGRVRAYQDVSKDPLRILGIVVHGDAAVSGQGVVMESFQMSQLDGYKTQGTIHVVLNNRIGFTAEENESRSSRYCTDIAKMLGSPVIHVNAEDIDAVAWAFETALLYRQQFHDDIWIDLVGYRRHGHNEGDEPSFTQPIRYQKIHDHPFMSSIYEKRLIGEGILDVKECNRVHEEGQTYYSEARSLENSHKSTPHSDWMPFLKMHQSGSWPEENLLYTGCSLSYIQEIGEKLIHIPETFSLHPKLRKLVDQRQHSFLGERSLDWGAGEQLALATLLLEGTSIRFVGQDVGRGTFSHRHAVLKDTQTGLAHIPLQHLSSSQGRFEIFNSLLSESASLGFEYGYSAHNPDQLVIWEAQFGDFCNGAQVIIDQFISSGESKWNQLSNLVLLLPHGYEGQGPEHSSGRMERFLQLSAEYNWRIVVPTTPANLFHVLRQQIHAPYRKPLVIFSPKSLLRHPLATSSLSDFSETSFFQTLYKDTPSGSFKRVILCSGKIYVELASQRMRKDVALVRFEQLYPFPQEAFLSLIDDCSEVTDWVWCQEEPQNMGAYTYIYLRLNKILNDRLKVSLRYIGRPPTASPATGYALCHEREQASLTQQVFEGE